VIAHWDDVEIFHGEKGPMAGSVQRLGDAAGTKTVGVNRVRIDPGRLPTPPHSHGRSEEIFYVLGGSGLLWQDEHVCEVRTGDTIVHLPDTEEHTLRAGPDGLDVLIFGTRHPVEYGWLPRSKSLRFGYPWVEGRTDNPWDIEEQIGELEFDEPGERPLNVVNVDDVEADEDGDKELAGSAGSMHSGLNYNRRDPGRASSPPHNHSEEEEVFVILEGSGTLELWPAPIVLERGLSKREDHEVRAGHVIARPPGSRIGHRLLAGPEGMTYLVYGTRKPNDIVYYPHSKKIFFRGVGVIARVEHVEYWDGEARD
jgi:uncharacterized cupin superfamily protein